MDRAALAEFLTNRRGSLQPKDVGLTIGQRRRVPGLRRDEVAQLAAMSTDYYARLEQQRSTQPSVQMLASLARALRMNTEERDYLYRIAGHTPPDSRSLSEHVSPGLMRILDRLTDAPGFVTSAVGDVLAQNAMARSLFGDASGYTGIERSGIYRWFMMPDTERTIYPEADRLRHSRSQVASLRAAYGFMGARSRAGEIMRELSRRSEEFAGLWKQQEVWRRFADHKVLIHPEVGELELDCQALFSEDQSQSLIVLTAAANSPAEQKLKLLAVVGGQEFADGR